MSFECILYDENDGVGVLTINRPKALNALNAQVLKELQNLLGDLKRSSSLRCLIVTGAGEKSFVAGADIKEMEKYSPQEALEMSMIGQDTFKQIEDLKVPSIAAVNGFALGGGMELALACDFIIASESAKFGLPEVTLGLIPGYGGTQRLSRNIGRSLAKMVTFSGDLYSVEEAQKWGLVAEVLPADDMMARCQKLATKISQRSPMALALAKRSMAEGADQPLAEGLRIEANYFSQTFSTDDHVEGIQAFIEKRKANFTGK